MLRKIHTIAEKYDVLLAEGMDLSYLELRRSQDILARIYLLATREGNFIRAEFYWDVASIIGLGAPELKLIVKEFQQFLDLFKKQHNIANLYTAHYYTFNASSFFLG